MKTVATCKFFRKSRVVEPGFSALCLLLIMGVALIASQVQAGEVTTAPENPAGAEKKPDKPPEDKKEGGEAEKSEEPPKDKKEKVEAKKPDDSWWLSGYNKLKFRFRYTREDRDYDVYDTISLTIQDRKKDPLYKFHIHARGVVDIGDRLKPGEYSDFRDLNDRYGSHAHGDLYSAYMDFRDLFPHTKFRLGRQRVYEAEGVNFDGARIEMELSRKKFWWSIFGGGSVHRYEENRHDDSVVGTGLKYKSSKKFQVRAEFVRATDKRIDQPILNEDPAENLYFLSAKWKPSKKFNLYGRLSWIDSNQPREPFQPRRYLVRAAYKNPDAGLIIKFTGVSQRHTISDITTEFNDFVSTMREYHPYYQVKLYIYKEFSDTVATEITYAQRELRYPDRDEGIMNHEFGEGSFALVFSDVFGNGSELTVEASYFDTRIDDIATWGFDWTMPWTRDKKGKPVLSTSIGSEFSRYKYDIFNEIEREGVRSVYGKLIYKLSKKWRFTFKWEWESDDFDIYNTATVYLKYKF